MHDLNLCYYGKPMLNSNKTQTVTIIKFHCIKMVVTVFTDVTVFVNEHKCTFAS